MQHKLLLPLSLNICEPLEELLTLLTVTEGKLYHVTVIMKPGKRDKSFPFTYPLQSQQKCDPNSGKDAQYTVFPNSVHADVPREQTSHKRRHPEVTL
ncbi:hypothetical protein STEG23_013277 [Scotinomys teguina]